MTPPIARIPAALMLLSFAAGCALHVDRAPAWCTAAAACGLLWYWLHTTGRVALPRKWARYALTALLFIGVLMSFGTVNGLAAGSTLLMAMGGAKLLETRTARDAVVITTVALILVLAAGLDRQDLLRLPLYLATGWLALATLSALGSHTGAGSMRHAFRQSGAAMLLAIPFAVLAFALVPRLPGALWSMPGSEKAQTGLADEMSPGSISELAISDIIAFRVRFEGEAPPPDQRYWRGPVLHDFDGFTWRGGRAFAGAPRQPVEYLSEAVRYQVMLEPHHRPYLPVLDAPVELSGRRYFRSFDDQFLAQRPVTSALIYDAVSHTRWRHPGELSTLATRMDTRLPEGRNPRSIELARRLRAQAEGDADYARQVMAYFRDNGFEYSLTPPLLNYNSVDDLLFNTRLGFCGHFASAFVTLLRAAGVPARVVTGYLGGTWNPVGGYFVVRQSEAHAWAEAWLEGEGWVRFDPTGMVAPERLQRGLSEFLPQARSATTALVQNTGWLRTLRDSWDAAGSWWRERIVNFNAAQQRDLLGRLGLGNLDYRGMSLLLLVAAISWGAVLLAFAHLRTRRPPPDALGALWQRYIQLLQRAGVSVAAHEGPEHVRQRARAALPAAASHIDRFSSGYMAARFGRNAGTDLRGLQQELRALARSLSAR